MANQNKNIAVVAGASLAALVLGVLFYIWKMKQDDDDDGEELDVADLNAREEESVASAGQTVVNVKVPQHVVGSIIGKDGANIKQLRAQFGVRFNFDRDDRDQENSVGKENKQSERILEIRGQRDKVRLAEYKIKALISETPKFNDTELFIPSETCGRIIGKGGQNIREMCSISGARITLEREENKALGNQRRITLSGTSVQIEYAKLLIKEKVEQALADTKKYGRKGDEIKEKTYDFREITLPSSGEYFQVFVSSSTTPNDFWVQLVSKESAKLDHMTDEMTELYGKMAPDEERLQSGNVGDVCVAPFDGGMFRAAIRKINIPNRTAELLFIDYGDITSVPLDDIKEMRFEYKEMYGQAVHCQLPVDPAGGSWLEESCVEFAELCHSAEWKPLMAKVLDRKRTAEGDVYSLQMVDTSTDEDVDVGATLVTKGHAVPAPNNDVRV